MTHPTNRVEKYALLRNEIKKQSEIWDKHAELTVYVEKCKAQLLKIDEDYFKFFFQEFEEDFKLQAPKDIQTSWSAFQEHEMLVTKIQTTIKEMKEYFKNLDHKKKTLYVCFDSHNKHNPKLQKILDQIQMDFSKYQAFYRQLDLTAFSKKPVAKAKKTKFDVSAWSRNIRLSNNRHQKTTENFIKKFSYKEKWYYILIPILTAIAIGLICFSLFY